MGRLFLNTHIKRSLSSFAGLVFILLSTTALAVDWTYTVRKDDTLWGLCKKYTKVANCWLRIGPYNGVEYPRNLAPGTRIRFPVEWLINAPSPVKVSFVRGSASKRAPDANDNEPANAESGSATNLTSPQIPVARGDLLTIGTTLFVDSDSLVVLEFADGSVMVVDGDSELTFDVLSSHGDNGMVDTRIHLKKGAVQTKVKKRLSGARFEISTPSSVAAVRGTDFRVTSIDGEAPATRNAVFSGSVAVSNERQETLLPPGKGVVAKQNEALSKVVDLLPPSRLLNVQPQSLMPFELDWEDLDGAQRYRLEIVSAGEDERFTSVIQADVSNYTINGLEEGCYIFRVSGIDRFEFQGMPVEQESCVADAPISPDNVSLSGSGKQKVIVTWPEVEGIKKYRVEVSNTPDFQTVTQTYNVDRNTLELPVYSPSTRYVRVISIDERAVETIYESLPSDTLEIAASQPAEKNVLGITFFVTVLFVLLI